MGFDWTAIIIGTIGYAAHMNQMKTNIDVVYVDLELDLYAWSEMPVSIGSFLDDADFQELRDAIDFAKDQNTCRNHDADYDLADNATAKVGVDTTAYTGADSPHRATVYSNQDSGYDSTYNYGVDSSYDSSVNGTYNSGVDSGYDSQVYSNEDSGYESSNDETHAGTHNLFEHTGQNSAYCSGD